MGGQNKMRNRQGRYPGGRKGKKARRGRDRRAKRKEKGAKKDHPGLENVVQIEKFQEKAYKEFQDYVTIVYPDDTYRLSRLLLRLPALRLMSAAITEELFFAGLIGNVQIDSIIPYILRMETADYNSQIIGHAV
ncbi:UNVERIFIED_CONTAM: Nuclear receptor subfamily 2 group C member 1-A [Gekko kuhli]